LASAELGEARHLPWDNDTIDACLFFGPMYHLTALEDRMIALAEARRVLRTRGLLLVTAISRFQSLYTGLMRGDLADPAYQAIVERDLADGQHRNPERNPAWFTTAYSHLPQAFALEVESAGFCVAQLIAVDGPARVISDLGWWLEDDARRETLMTMVRRVETQPSLLGASPQLLAVAHKSPSPLGSE
jgi:SAM-dependent methyltransferase